MHAAAIALIHAAEEAGAESSGTPAWVFGVVAFGTLALLLVATMMIKVGRRRCPRR